MNLTKRALNKYNNFEKEIKSFQRQILFFFDIRDNDDISRIVISVPK